MTEGQTSATLPFPVKNGNTFLFIFISCASPIPPLLSLLPSHLFSSCTDFISTGNLTGYYTVDIQVLDTSNTAILTVHNSYLRKYQYPNNSHCHFYCSFLLFFPSFLFFSFLSFSFLFFSFLFFFLTQHQVSNDGRLFQISKRLHSQTVSINILSLSFFLFRFFIYLISFYSYYLFCISSFSFPIWLENRFTVINDGDPKVPANYSLVADTPSEGPADLSSLALHYFMGDGWKFLWVFILPPLLFSSLLILILLLLYLFLFILF